jgi:hypothetical protein
MAASRIRSSEATSRRRVNRSRDLWLDFFSAALESLLSSDDEKVKEFTDQEAAEIAASAAKVADKALEKTEERFPGL